MRIALASRGVRSRLRSESGSIVGGMTYIGIASRPSNPGIGKTATSYWSAKRRKKAHARACADEQSKWHRHTHRPAARALTRLAGWLSGPIVTAAAGTGFFAVEPLVFPPRAHPPPPPPPPAPP